MMECPSCRDSDAYVGLSSVECLNPDCVHFKETYLEEKLRESDHVFASLLSHLKTAGIDFQDILDRVRL